MQKITPFCKAVYSSIIYEGKKQIVHLRYLTIGK